MRMSSRLDMRCGHLPLNGEDQGAQRLNLMMSCTKLRRGELCPAQIGSKTTSGIRLSVRDWYFK
jgi:hypothetical protein